MAWNELFLGIQGLGIGKSLAACTQETQISFNTKQVHALKVKQKQEFWQTHFNCSTGPTGQYSAINAQEWGLCRGVRWKGTMHTWPADESLEMDCKDGISNFRGMAGMCLGYLDSFIIRIPEK